MNNNTRVLNKINTPVVCLFNTSVLDLRTMEYGERLRLARTYKGLSQTELAERSGVGQGSISKIERGDQEYSAYDVEFGLALDVHPAWLKLGDDRFAPEWLGTFKLDESDRKASKARKLIKGVNVKKRSKSETKQYLNELMEMCEDLIYEGLYSSTVDATRQLYQDAIDIAANFNWPEIAQIEKFLRDRVRKKINENENNS
jgi:transcriptional regulator with XRE-family HTH domain